MPPLKISFNASVIPAGLASPTGGSRKLLETAKAKKPKLVTSLYAIEETVNHFDKLKINADQLTNLLVKKLFFLLKIHRNK